MRHASRLLTLLAVLLGIGAGTAAANEPAPRQGAQDKERKQVVTFDGDTIDGDLTRPDGDLVSVRPELEWPSLVEAPRSFDAASRRTLLDSADALR